MLSLCPISNDRKLRDLSCYLDLSDTLPLVEQSVNLSLGIFVVLDEGLQFAAFRTAATAAAAAAGGGEGALDLVDDFLGSFLDSLTEELDSLDESRTGFLQSVFDFATDFLERGFNRCP